MSGTLVFTPGALVFATATHGTPLDCLVLEARGRLCSWAAQDRNNWKVLSADKCLQDPAQAD